jgi:hypothetical protein
LFEEKQKAMEKIDAKTRGWWNSLSAEDKRLAREEAHEYEALSEVERHAIWNEFAESRDEKDEGDENRNSGQRAKTGKLARVQPRPGMVGRMVEQSE